MTRPVNRMRPVHPGEILREDYLVPLEMSVNALAMALGVPTTRMHEIVKERRGVTADTAERLAGFSAAMPNHGWHCKQRTTSKCFRTNPAMMTFPICARRGYPPRFSALAP